MPKLTRYLQKIFANNSNQVGVFGTGTDKETSKNVETLQSADYENGWSSAIITNKNYPIWQEMDGVQYGLSYQLKYLFQNGIPEWLSTETYYTNSYCRVGSTIYYSLQDNNTNHNPALDNGWWTPLLTSNRSIGEIIPSCVPLTEAGLHLLDGALITNGMYADFVTYMVNLTATAPDIFCTEAEWQQSVSQYGVCGKFVYDSVNNTVRLPKITGIVEGTTDLTALGDLVKAGLPSIGTITNVLTYPSASTTTGSISYDNPTQVFQSGGVYYAYNGTINFDNNPIYGNSSKVQPQTIKILYYIVIATSTKTDIQVDIDEIATDLNGKADVDLTNCTDTADIKMVHNAMPSNTYDDLTLGASGTTYTAPADGWFYFSKDSGAPAEWAIFTDGTDGISGACGDGTWTTGYGVHILRPVAKGVTVKLDYSLSGPTNYFRFIYAVGSESEAS